MTTPVKKSKSELAVELVEALAWPLLVLFLVVTFWRPLRDSANEIPRMLRDAESLSIGEFSLKLPVYLRHEATPEVKAALLGLSSPAVGQLLRFKDTMFFTTDEAQVGRDEMKELIARGLLTELPSKDLRDFSAEHHETYSYGVHITELGRKTRDLLRSVTLEFIQQLPAGD